MATFTGLLTGSAISLPVALLNLAKNIFRLCLSFNLKAFKRQQLYDIWPYMRSIIICPCVYNPIYYSFNSSCSKVYCNIDVRMYGTFGAPFLWMKSISSSQWLTLVYEAWSCSGDRMISFPFDSQRITTMNVVYCNSGRLLLSSLPTCSPKSVTGRSLPCFPHVLTSQILVAQFFKTCEPSTSKWIQHYRKYWTAASSRMSPIICKHCLPVPGSISKVFHMVLPPENGLMLILNPSHPYFLPLAECTVVGLPHSVGKLLQQEFGLLEGDSQFAFSTARVQHIIDNLICIIIVVRNLQQWGPVHNRWYFAIPRLLRRLEQFQLEASWGSPRSAGSRVGWRISAGRCCPIDWIVFRSSWRKSQCTWQRPPLSWNMQRGEHLRPTITNLVGVISLPLWPITWISLACAGGWVQTVSHVECRMEITLWRAWKWLRWRRVTIPRQWMMLIGLFPKSTVVASGRSWTIFRGFWVFFMALLHATMATQWRKICWRQLRSVCRHVLCIKMVVNYYRRKMWYRINQRIVEYIAGSSDPHWKGDLLISHSVVMICGFSLHLSSMKQIWQRNSNLNHTHPTFLCYMLEFKSYDIG